MHQQSLLTIYRTWIGPVIRVNPDALPPDQAETADQMTRGEDQQVA